MMRKKIKLLLLIAWMLLIFYMSSCNGESSSGMSSGLLLMIARFLNIKDAVTFVANYSFIIRKLAHFSEFFILGLLMYINIKNISSISILISIVLCFLYALSDEIHQLFVSDRVFALFDIMIDTLGSITGVCLTNLIMKRCFQEKKH